MSFHQAFKATQALSESSVVAALFESAPLAGAYDYGVLSVLDSALSRSLAEQWQWLLGADASPLAHTAFGDIIFKSEKHASVFFIEIQRYRSTAIDKSVELVFNQFLPSASIRANVLREEKAQALIQHLGPLDYGQCFIATPWECIGGSGAIDTYMLGDVVVFNSLIAQTVRRMLDERRQA